MVKKDKLLSFLLDYLNGEENFVFLWNGRLDNHNYYSYIFTSPIECLQCYEKDEVLDVLNKVEQFQKDGYYVVGFVSYEAGMYLDDAVFDISQQMIDDFPLIWFGIYKDPIIYDHRSGIFNKTDIEQQFSQYTPKSLDNCHIDDITSSVEHNDYISKIWAVKSAIERGETYQVNYTFKHKFDFIGNAEGLFFELCMKQSASYSAFIRTPKWDILSLSPELFFQRHGDHVMVKPMKGTINRGINNDDDAIKADELYNSAKDRAENVMIVDLLRNDIGRISKMGSVRVTKLYEIEKYETLFQMTSTVESELRKNIRWIDFFRSIFPCGSVTGAPKIKTMHIINELENEHRGVYTGSIGFIAPDNTSVFNVAIRTAVLDRINGNGEMGIGSGIVYDSDAESEFRECLLKANFLTSQYNDFQLIETMLWENGEFYLLDLHLGRLKGSAEYFMFNYDKVQIIRALEDESQKYANDVKNRTRLLLFRDGSATISSAELDETNDNIKKVRFSPIRTNPDDRFLYHKTTNRKIYDDEFRRANSEGYHDFLFLNTQGEVTEGAISNIFIMKDSKFYTPPVRCGLLNGVFRQYLIKNNPNVEEKILFEKDIIAADKIYLTNSVRGMCEVILDQ